MTEEILNYMSPQARRRLHRTMASCELEDLAREIAMAFYAKDMGEGPVLETVKEAIFRGREND